MLLIKPIFESAGKVFENDLKHFYPAQGENGINERNLTYRFMSEFSKKYNNSRCFLEVPLLNKSTNKFDLHIDGLIIHDGIAIFIESKRLYSKEKATLIDKDISRLNYSNLTSIIANHGRIESPNQFFALLIAETWETRVRDWWVGKQSSIKWDRNKLSSFSTDFVPINHSANENLNWLFAYKKIGQSA